MKQAIIIVSMLIWTVSTTQAQSVQNRVTNYIQQYHLFAVHNQVKYNIPASITLAQGILESNSGMGVLADSAMNHFGIKCKDNWLGKVFYRLDDDLDTLGNLVPSCFRSYASVQESYFDHSDFLVGNARYKRLFQLRGDDYKGWASGLKQCGYATAATYDKSLIDLIEKYSLNVFDEISEDEQSLAWCVYQTFNFIKKQKEKQVQSNIEDLVVTLPDYYKGQFLIAPNE